MSDRGSSVPRHRDIVVFLLFFASGFCGLLYQVVWLRLAFAAFGVITPVLSVVVSVFMLGLAIGSWAGGKWVGIITTRTGRSAIGLYASVELLIGLGAFVVPRLFSVGEAWLLQAGEMDSLRYLLLSAVILSLSLLPWCVFMGATFPLMMSYLRECREPQPNTFSYLYLANVIGAMCGTLLTACVLIELLGFRGCLIVAGSTNFLIAVTASLLGMATRRRPTSTGSLLDAQTFREPSIATGPISPLVVPILFMTGFVSMAMEVVWTRAFTPILKTTVYAFAALLTAYLLATWIGSLVYRFDLRNRRVRRTADLLAVLTVASLLPVLVNDPRWAASFYVKVGITLISIFPFCAALGYLTPRLLDEYSGGAPRRAGTGYAINIVGCILGPLFAGYVLLPFVGLRHSLLLLSVPFPIFYLYAFRPSGLPLHHGLLTLGPTAALAVISLFRVISYEDSEFYRSAEVRRDHVATVVSCGRGMEKRLLVNGIGLTNLTQVTKNMAHVPLGMLTKEPTSVLVICLGMGTTFRSAASWNVETKAVELVPSVRDAIGYYWPDAESILRRPNARVVIDDGRRFLSRTPEKFDLITIDPPPPVEAAGSSLLYSEEFYSIASAHLKEGGILAQWTPGGEEKTSQAMAKAIRSIFPHVRVFVSLAEIGYHFFASRRPVEVPDAKTFLSRIPPAALADFVEWTQRKNGARLYQECVRREVPLDQLLTAGVTWSITDDRPFNEYFLLRRLRGGSRDPHRQDVAAPAPGGS
jgi:spermidine synthase